MLGGFNSRLHSPRQVNEKWNTKCHQTTWNGCGWSWSRAAPWHFDRRSRGRDRGIKCCKKLERDRRREGNAGDIPTVVKVDWWPSQTGTTGLRLMQSDAHLTWIVYAHGYGQYWLLSLSYGSSLINRLHLTVRNSYNYMPVLLTLQGFFL